MLYEDGPWCCLQQSVGFSVMTLVPLNKALTHNFFVKSLDVIVHSTLPASLLVDDHAYILMVSEVDNPSRRFSQNSS